MKKRIRIGNDIFVTWTVKDDSGNAYDLTGHDVRIILTCDLGAAKVRDIIISGNVITFWFRGRDQRATGPYGLVLIDNGCTDGMVTYDIREVFYLVDHSWNATDGECGCCPHSEVTVETVELESEITPERGPQGVPGLSAYEVAVLEGFEGTVVEWLESLRGPVGPASTVPGPAGPQGGIIWPDIYVDANMYLHICEPETQLQDRFSFRNGYLIIN